MPPKNYSPNDPMFVTWHDEKGKQLALTTAANAAKEYGAIAHRESTQASTLYMNVGTNQSVRDGLNRRDWDYFRPDEAVPRNMRHVMAACMQAYRKVGIVKNIIDLMGEFTCKGLELVHQNKSIEKLYQEWSRRVGLKERAERFCNYLYRTANVIVQRDTAILPEKDIANFRQGLAAEDIDKIDPPPKVRKGEIPWSYTFINPLALDILGGDELAQFAGVAIYGLTVPERVYNKIRNPKTQEERFIISQLPEYIVTSVRNGIKVIPLDPGKVQTFFYKKDDWQVWAEPMIFSILDDIILFNKMRLADLSALDGAISHIRLWRLGSLEHEILPTPAAIARLADILVNNTAVGAIDLIWGPELDFKETATEVYKFLGSEKYSQVVQNIYDSLGVPYSLRGGASKGGGMTAYLSLAVLMERLKYGRERLSAFIDGEVRMFQRAMGLRFPAQQKYDYMVLDDPNAFLRLLIELADRDYMSVESIQEAFGNLPEIEELRIRREHQKRDSGKMKPKAGPYHQPQVDDELLKIFAQTGVVTPSEAGVELGERKPGEKTLVDQQAKVQKDVAALKPAPVAPGINPTQSKPKGKAGQGRPAGSRDTVVRKKRAIKPTKAAEFFTTRAWARDIQTAIAEVVNPVYVENCGKKNVRSLTEEEFKSLEEFKFAVLCNLQPYSQFNNDSFVIALKSDKPLVIPILVNELYATTLGKFAEKFNRQPTVDEQRLFRAEVYALYTESVNSSENDDDESNEDEVTQEDLISFMKMED